MNDSNVFEPRTKVIKTTEEDREGDVQLVTVKGAKVIDETQTIDGVEVTVCWSQDLLNCSRCDLRFKCPASLAKER